MSYEPTTWKSGDVVTSSKLNKMEQGIANAGGGGGVFIVHDVENTLDKTWKEISDAFEQTAVFVVIETPAFTSMFPVIIVGASSGYSVITNTSPSPTTYTTDSENGYPVSGAPK